MALSPTFNNIKKMLNAIRITTSPKNQNGLRILCYHSISPLNSTSPIPKNNLLLSDFINQMDYLKTNGFNCIDFRQLERYLNDEINIPAKSFIITFDDGFKNILTYAYPVLSRYKYYCIIFVATDYIDSTNPFDFVDWKILDKKKASKVELRNIKKDYHPLSKNEIRNLSHFENVLIGSHGCSHTPLTRLTWHQIIDEVKNSKAILENITGRQIKHFALPYGKYDKKILSLVSSIYRYTYSVEKGIVNKGKKKPINRHSIKPNCDISNFQAHIYGRYDWIQKYREIKNVFYNMVST